VLAVPISDYNKLVAETLADNGAGSDTPAVSAAGSRYASPLNLTDFSPGPRGSTGKEAIEMEKRAAAGKSTESSDHFKQSPLFIFLCIVALNPCNPGPKESSLMLVAISRIELGPVHRAQFGDPTEFRNDVLNCTSWNTFLGVPL
jgi:hypothetical protein